MLGEAPLGQAVVPRALEVLEARLAVVLHPHAGLLPGAEAALALLLSFRAPERPGAGAEPARELAPLLHLTVLVVPDSQPVGHAAAEGQPLHHLPAGERQHPLALPSAVDGAAADARGRLPHASLEGEAVALRVGQGGPRGEQQEQGETVAHGPRSPFNAWSAPTRTGLPSRLLRSLWVSETRGEKAAALKASMAASASSPEAQAS